MIDSYHYHKSGSKDELEKYSWEKNEKTNQLFYDLVKDCLYRLKELNIERCTDFNALEIIELLKAKNDLDSALNVLIQRGIAKRDYC